MTRRELRDLRALPQHERRGDFTCDLTLFQGPFSPTTNFPITRRNAGSSPTCKASIPWCSSSAAALSAPRTADRLKGFLNSIVRWRLAIAGLSRSVPYFGRPTMEDLRQDLRAVTKKCRPDWDITTPELKAAWQQGRKDLFYPYGKTYVQTLGEQD